MSNLKAVGRPTPLIDGRAKVTGDVRYTPDLQMAGMLHARFVPSLYPHATIRQIDATVALAVPGVVAVLTARDLPDIAPSNRSRLLLARGRTIFAGQPVALVLADNEDAAQDAVDLVQVDYEPLPAVITMDEALAKGAPLVWPNGVPSGASDAGAHGADAGGDKVESGELSNIAGQGVTTRGDVARGFAEADAIVEGTFTTPMVHQSALETQAVIAQPDPGSGRIMLWASTQTPFAVRQEVAAVLGIAESDVRVIAMAVGGGFGGKNILYEPLAAAAAWRVGRPVRLVLTRMEELLATNPAPPMRLHVRLGAKRDGTLTALESEVHGDQGCFPAGLAGFVNFQMGSLYRIPNLHLTSIDVMTFKQSAAAYRGPGGQSAMFAMESLMDELAAKLGLDPLELRLRNIVQPGDLTTEDKPWPGMGAREVLETLQKHPAWQNRAQARAAGRGVGIAVCGWPGATEPAAAVCALHRDGLLHIHVGSVDLGGTTTSFALLAAEVFGVPPENVRVITSDTDTAPYAGYSAGSKVTYTTGAAVVMAAREARQQALAIAAEEFEAAVEDLEIVGDRIQVRGVPAKGIKLGDIAGKTMQFDGKYAPVFAHGRIAQPMNAPAFAAQLAEVEVDRETGAVQTHKLVVVQDVGRAINPLAVEGQLMGGATQGIGWALYENMEYDEQGQLVTGSWMDYAVPSMTQAASSMEVVLVEVPSEHGPFGARGVGEPPVIPTAAAIANAIADAAGVRMTELPMTAPRVHSALEAAK